MKFISILCLYGFFGVAMAGEGWHHFSSGENPHAKGGCSANKDKMSQFHKLNGKKWGHGKAEKKVESENDKKPEPRLEDFI